MTTCQGCTGCRMPIKLDKQMVSGGMTGRLVESHVGVGISSVISCKKIGLSSESDRSASGWETHTLIQSTVP